MDTLKEKTTNHSSSSGTAKTSSKKAPETFLKLSSSISYLKGVGPKLGELFQRHGIRKIEDFLFYFPRTYEDQKVKKSISQIQVGELISLKARIASVKTIPLGRSTKRIYDVTLQDASGKIHCKFFRLPFRGYLNQFEPMQEIRLVGKAIVYKGQIEFHHPDIRVLKPEDEDLIQDQVNPIYSEMEGFSSAKVARLIQRLIQDLPGLERPRDFLPESIQKKYSLPEVWESVQKIHQPPSGEVAKFVEIKAPEQKKIIFNELFWLECLMACKQLGFKKEKGLALSSSFSWDEILKSLPFELTGAQKKVLSELESDLQKPSPMHRLVQGDVGSGKTILALLSSWMAFKNKTQSCLMAPTEILAEQHFKNAIKIFHDTPLQVALLTGKTKAADRKILHEKLEAGEIDLLIGTHALIEDTVLFKKLSLVIVDEQHRFGVQQRAALKKKGPSPHFLLMTATPIPRTLSLTVYGDLDISIVDELPPGRTPIQTRVINQSKRPQALDFLKDQVSKGRQGYLVYPLVEESETLDLKNAEEEFLKLRAQFPQFQLGLLHGRMKSEEKESIMEQFRKNEIQILVSTTVIEVGVDVPNATLMIVENAERFGLSQLHQLRGRVGRGAQKSSCVFILGHAVSDLAYERTRFLESTQDGFKISEFDLKIRGPGELIGLRQSGLPQFKLAEILRDAAILEVAKKEAFAVFEKDPQLLLTEHKVLRENLQKALGANSPLHTG